MKYVVLGAGPTGLSSLRELIKRGVPLGDILLIDQEFFPTGYQSANNLSKNSGGVFEVTLREGATQGLGKSGLGLNGSAISKPSTIWGVSCLPPMHWNMDSNSITESEIQEAYADVASDWEIQSTFDFDDNFPFSGEVMGNLPRKQMSKTFTKVSGISNSRLAISAAASEYSEGCKLSAKCFSRCPNNAPWTPQKSLRKILDEHPGINLLEAKVIGICRSTKLVLTSVGSISFDFLYLSLGALNTQNILKSHFHEEIELETTPVVLLPLLLKRRGYRSDYNNSFHYCDLVVPQTENNMLVALTQLYLPTTEITGRIIATLPKIFHKFLAGRILPLLSFFFKRVGICMIFLKSVHLDTHEGPSKLAYREELRFLNSRLRKAGSIALNISPRLLLNGDSYHLGSLHFHGEFEMGINSRIFHELVHGGIYITDASALPQLTPGPHTAIAAALARVVVKKSLIS
jgi:hypothetical protein